MCITVFTVSLACQLRYTRCRNDYLLSYYMQGRRRSHDVISMVRLDFVSERNGPRVGERESCCLTDVGLAAVGDGFTKIEKLSLVWCTSVTSEGLRSMAEKCKFLKALDLQVNM